MSDAVATRSNFERLQDSDRERYRRVLEVCDQLQLGCRCIMAGGRDFTIVVGKGLATAKFWLAMYDLT